MPPPQVEDDGAFSAEWLELAEATQHHGRRKGPPRLQAATESAILLLQLHLSFSLLPLLPHDYTKARLLARLLSTSCQPLLCLFLFDDLVDCHTRETMDERLSLRRQ